MKRLALILLALLCCTAAVQSQKREPGKVKTLVIDPGHGGAKPGAISKRIVEKDLVLGVATKFGALVEQNYPDVKIIYTRKSDVDIDLSKRAEIANHAKADLFISIHANSHPTVGPSGVETFVMGLSKSKANLEVAKKENADILLEAGYKSNSAYQGFDPNSPESNVMFAMYQNAYISKSLDFANYIQKQYAQHTRSINRGVKQAELFVIYKTAMPSVLTEIGFISNPDEESFLISRDGQERIALCLYNAFAQYKAREEGTQPKILDHYTLHSSTTAVATATKDEGTTPNVGVVALPLPPATPAETVAMSEDPAPQPAATVGTAPKQEPAATPATPNQEPAAAKADSNAALPAPTVQPAPATAKADVVPAENVAAATTAAPAIAATENAATKSTETKKEKVVYKVQFMRANKLLQPGDRELKGLDNYEYYNQGKMYCYVWGKCNSINAAKQIQSDVRQRGFSDAFVVAFYKGERIGLQEAREITGE